MPLVLALSLAVPVEGVAGQPSEITVTTADSSRTVKVLAPQQGTPNTAEDIQYFVSKVLDRKLDIGIDAQWTDPKFARILRNSIYAQLSLVNYIEDLSPDQIKSFQTFSVNKNRTYGAKTETGTEMVTVLRAKRDRDYHEYYFKLTISETTIKTTAATETKTKVEICPLTSSDTESEFYRKQVKQAKTSDADANAIIEHIIRGQTYIPTALGGLLHKTGLSKLFTTSCPTCTQPTVSKGDEILV